MVKAEHIALAGIAGISLYLVLTNKAIQEQLASLGAGLGQAVGGMGGLGITMPSIAFPSLAFPSLAFPSIAYPTLDLSWLSKPLEEYKKKAEETVAGVTGKGIGERVSEWISTTTTAVSTATGKGLATLATGWVKPYAETVYQKGQETGLWLAEKGLLRPIIDLPKNIVEWIMFKPQAEFIAKTTIEAFKPKYRGLGTQMIGATAVEVPSGIEGIQAGLGGIVGKISGTIQTITKGVTGGTMTVAKKVSEPITYGITTLKTPAQRTWESLTPEPFRRYIYGW